MDLKRGVNYIKCRIHGFFVYIILYITESSSNINGTVAIILCSFNIIIIIIRLSFCLSYIAN